MGSALDSASLIMYPSGYSDGVLGSAKPTDGSGDFTFTRGSNLSATRVGPNGYIEKGYENLLLQSNSFDTTWGIAAAGTATGGQAGYDATNDAWSITRSAGGSLLISQSISLSGVNTYSLYIKVNTSNGVAIAFGGPSEIAFFNISNTSQTSAVSSTGLIDSNQTYVGNDFYKISITSNTTASILRLYILNSDGSNFDVNGGTHIIQDAMLNQGLVAYPYIETTTAPVAGGILEDEPRIDFSDGCGHLLLEPSRTNLVPHSEYLNAIVTKSDSLEMNTADTQSPEGVYNASKFSFASGTRYIGPPVGAPNNISFSVFAKAGTHNFIQFVTSATNLFAVNFDLSDGSSNVVGTAPSELQYDAEDYGNGWYRIWFYYDNAASAATIYCWIVNSITASRASSVSTSGDIYLYGFQLEQDATYPTSYIPTYGVSQTRLQDTTADLSSPAIAGATEFTWFFDNTGATIVPASNPIFWLRSDTNNNLIYWATQGGRFNSVTYFGFHNSIGKVCVKYDGTTFTMFLNGVKSTDTLTKSFGTTSELKALNYTNEGFSGPLHKMLFFKTALSDSECIALTTI